MIRTLIVDDEIPARNELRRFLRGNADFQVLGEAADGETALALVQKHKPDVVFLDIQIPKKSGLEVAAALAKMKEPPLVVFVTAFDQYAVQAFEVNAIDYVLKPYDLERFQKTCQKIQETYEDRLLAKKKLTSLTEYFDKEKRMQLTGHARNSRERILIRLEDVLYFHAELTEVTAFLRDGSEFIVNATLKSLLDLLDPAQFQQTHKAFVVNLGQVLKVSPLFSGNFEVALKEKNTPKIPLSRRYVSSLKQVLKW